MRSRFAKRRADCSGSCGMKPRDLNSIAADIEAKIVELEAEKDAVPRAERRPINRRLHSLRGLLEWAKTRRGYDPLPIDVGLTD